MRIAEPPPILDDRHEALVLSAGLRWNAQPALERYTAAPGGDGIQNCRFVKSEDCNALRWSGSSGMARSMVLGRSTHVRSSNQSIMLSLTCGQPLCREALKTKTEDEIIPAAEHPQR